MTADPCVIAELRDLFRGGATPSRLVRHVVARHAGEPQVDRLVRAYFREAFGVPMFRANADLLTLPPELLSFAGVSADTIHQIVARRAEWDTSGVPSWMDTLTATDPGQFPERTAPDESQLLGGSVPDHSPESVRRLTATAQHLHEQVAILSRLVEQLQGQVVALEGGGERVEDNARLQSADAA